MDKTNVIRIVEQNKIKYKMYEYNHAGDFIDAVFTAKELNEDPNQVFKTIVLVSNNHYFVCVIPSVNEIDLKKAAKAFNQKSLEMVHVKDLLSITGYVRGGCSPIGMKKKFPTIIDECAKNFDSIIISAGKIGYQIELSPNDLIKLTNAKMEDIKRV